ncbi:MAG: B12-binding domain-containing radical SAM protein [Candidatus Bathyarchaeota archaeon]|nr:B12-binding domain-containing radical SAM protein [Candidatus Bathyarchaeota archaeon]
MNPLSASLDFRKDNLDKPGAKIILTASAIEMSDFYNSQFFAFMGGFSKGPIPAWLPRKHLYPPVESKSDGTAKYAPYGLRKVETVLLEHGFDESDVAVVQPHQLDSFVGSGTKVVGISTMDPLGMGYVSKTYSSLIGGGEPMNAIEFRALMRHPSFRRHKPTMIVGGAGAWQLERKHTMRSYGIDCVVLGESETIVADLFTKAVKGEKVPPVVHCNTNPTIEEIPSIKHPSLHGCVEISRGCGRNCQFCTPTMQQRRNFSIDKIMKEVAVNVKEGNGKITLATEDLFLYGAKDNGFIPNKAAVLELLKKVASYPGVTAVQPAHMSLAPVVYDPRMVKEAAEILIERNWHGYCGKPIVTAETGIETGSVRLLRKYMAGKPLPFKPEEWRELVPQAFGILNGNDWFPLATLIVGLPDETEDDVIQTLELIDDLDEFNALFVPLMFVPLEKCRLENQSGVELNNLSKLRWEFLTKCWEYNFRVWRSSYLEFRIRNPLLYDAFTKFVMPSIGFISGLYYGAKHGEIAKNAIWNMSGLT